MTILLEILGRNALAATLLAGLVLALTPFLRRPAARNALWLIVLARLLMPPIWDVPLPRFGIEKPPVASVPPLAPHVLNQASTVVDATPAPVLRPLVEELPRSIKATKAFAPSVSVLATAAMPPTPFRWSLLLLAIWGSGVLVVASLAFTRIRRFQRGLGDATLAPEAVQWQAAAIARRLGMTVAPRVELVPGRVPPMLWLPGLRRSRARLLLPLELYRRLGVEERGALIAHELAHLRRGDPWVRWLELLTVALYWWHPLLGFIRRRLRASEEECCDAWVVDRCDDRKAYATALLETVDFLDGPDFPAAPALASGAGPVHNLQRRLTMIMRGSMRNRLTGFGTLAVLGVAVGALAFGPSFTNAQPEEKKGRDQPPLKKDAEAPKGERKGEPGGPNEEARRELQKAREEAEKALLRVRELEERLRGGDGPMRKGPPIGDRKEGDAPKGPPMGDRKGPPMDEPKGPPMRNPNPDNPNPKFRPMDDGPRGNPQIQDLQRQIEEMRRAIEQLQRQLGEGPKGGPENPRGGPDKKDFRPPFRGRPNPDSPEKLPGPPEKKDN